MVAFVGGTDAYRAAPAVAGLLLATGAAFDATVVAADPGLRAELAALAPAAGQRLDVIDPTDDLPELLAEADLVISASGTSTWELLCLGLPAALIWVVDNQIIGYGRTTGRGLAAGLGHLPGLRVPGPAADEAMEVLRRLLIDPAERETLASRAWEAVDGQGCSRVADSLQNVIDTRA